MAKNVIIVTPGFAENENDSTCLPFLQMLIEELSARPELQLRILTFQYPFLAGKYNWKGIPVVSLGGKNRKGFSKVFTWKKAWNELQKMYSASKPDLIFSCWGTEAALIGGYFAKKKRVKHVCWIIGQDSKKENRYIPFISSKTVFACKTPFIQEHFKTNHGINPLHIIPNGLNEKSLPKLVRQERKIDLISVGSLIPLKRYDWLIRLVKDLKGKGFNLNCSLIGDGPEKEKLLSLIDEYSLQDEIKLAGLISHEETLKRMCESKILIHPSEFEGFSTVTLEALYAGCHVISTCQPFTETNGQMHVVKNYDELLKTAEILLSKELQHNSQLNYTTTKSTNEFMKILG